MNPVFSAVVPAFNEQEVLQQSFERLDAVMRGMNEPYELIFVDDGSRDATADILRGLAAEHPQVRTLHFSRNFGRQAAVRSPPWPKSGARATRSSTASAAAATVKPP